MACSGGDGFGGSGDAGLIGVAGAGGAHAGSHDGEIVPQFGAHCGSLAGGGDDALASTGQRQRGQTQDFIPHGSSKADFLQIIFVEAGQHRHAQHNQIRVGGASRLRGRSQHLATACGMHGQHAHAELGRFVHRRSHGVRNVVVFQIEKHAPARGHQLSHHLRALGGIELHADLVGQRRVSDGGHNLVRGCRRRNVQRYN